MPGECLVLHGRSGAGTSTLLPTLYGNYLPAAGSIRIRHEGEMLELAGLAPRQTLVVRRVPVGYVRPFLRVIPPVSCLNVAMAPARGRGQTTIPASSSTKEQIGVTGGRGK